jgi:phage tail-like protein
MSLDPYAYPVAGYSFELTVYKDQQPWQEIRCQSVTGIEMSIDWSKAGATQTTMTPLPPLANGLTYKDLVVTKGVVVKGNAFDKQLLTYMQRQATNNAVPFLELTLLLLDASGQPLRGWNFTRVVLSTWKVTGFDAQKSGFVVDELTFKYKEFTLVDWA